MTEAEKKGLSYSCVYFNSSKGCKNGQECPFIHVIDPEAATLKPCKNNNSRVYKCHRSANPGYDLCSRCFRREEENLIEEQEPATPMPRKKSLESLKATPLNLIPLNPNSFAVPRGTPSWADIAEQDAEENEQKSEEGQPSQEKEEKIPVRQAQDKNDGFQRVTNRHRKLQPRHVKCCNRNRSIVAIYEYCQDCHDNGRQKRHRRH